GCDGHAALAVLCRGSGDRRAGATLLPLVQGRQEQGQCEQRHEDGSVHRHRSLRDSYRERRDQTKVRFPDSFRNVNAVLRRSALATFEHWVIVWMTQCSNLGVWRLGCHTPSPTWMFMYDHELDRNVDRVAQRQAGAFNLDQLRRAGGGPNAG